MNDFGQEQQLSDNRITEDKFWNAYQATEELANEVGSLSENEITPENAPFIAGLILARTIEMHYLEQHQAGQHPLVEGIQGQIGQLQEILIEARRGDFHKLKKFCEEEADMIEKGSNVEQNTRGELEDYKNMYRNSQRIALVAKKMPETGNGSLIKVPNPLSVENKPIPLKLQLEKLKAGGDVQK